jgi:hypothetical protein
MQLSMHLPISFPKEAYEYGRRSSGDTHGVVLTKPHMVELILDLAGYSQDRDLARMRLLEPACGHGAFLVPAIRRLMTAAKAARMKPTPITRSTWAHSCASTPSTSRFAVDRAPTPPG